MIAKENLKAGDWIAMEFGSAFSSWYVWEVHGDVALLGKTNWYTEDSMWFNLSRVLKGTHLGRGKVRKWWKYLGPLRELVCPVSSYKR